MSTGRTASSSTATTAATALLCVAVAGGLLLIRRSQQQEERRQRRPRETASTDGDRDCDTATASLSASPASSSSSSSTTSRGLPTAIPSAAAAAEEDHLGKNLNPNLRSVQRPGTITVAYASTTDTCRNFAERTAKELNLRLLGGSKGGSKGGGGGTEGGGAAAVVQLCRVDELDWWDEVLNPEMDDDVDDDSEEEEEDGGGGGAQSSSSIEKANDAEAAAAAAAAAKVGVEEVDPIVIFILPTWSNGTLPPASQPLLTALDEISTDWRVAPNPLRPSKLTVAAFGVGSSAYDAETFCRPAKRVVELMGKLGARRLGRVGLGDVEVGDVGAVFGEWMEGTVRAVSKKCGGGGGNGKGRNCDKEALGDDAGEVAGCCEGGGGGGGAAEEDGACGCKSSAGENGTCTAGEGTDVGAVHEVCGDNDADDDDDDDSYYSAPDEENDDEPEIMDLEDIGNAMKSSSKKQNGGAAPKEMVTPKQAIALKKEGYKLIGTHSAVKLCRWTKHQLRGRGGCYKHTFYGITSYQCMEATPSLACANKCVFCWRHHKNPVGKEWRWKTDDPNFIVEQAVLTHVKMIKETKGIPGVRMDRWTEAHTVKHCALSLVGEPIMYPRIDELLADLHRRAISTFLVTNGQHPKAIDDLRPITQLYVSVDAPTPESLVAIDRPLFNDAWDRLRSSLRCLKAKGQRTVARLTVVKGWNSDEIGGYAKLIALGHCSLVEVKGVTFCGKSDASNLNMSNTPWHHEVVALTTKLRDELNKMHAEGGDDAPPEYGLACEHRHSVSVLLARVDQFAQDDPVTGDRKWKTWIDYDKFRDLAARSAADPAFTFGVTDYTAETPSWALFGADEEGFDPTDKRHRKKRKHPMYTKFDGEGIPTHDQDGEVIGEEERVELRRRMEEKREEIGSATSSVTELKGGEITVEDASLMYRGLTVTK